jgi:tRNA (mo5U34)-methyltransferase
MRGESMTLQEARVLVSSVRHWHHAFEIYPGVVTPGSYQPDFLLPKMQLPNSLRGLTVLDVGTSDGFFALRLAQRGANVVAVDYRAKADHGFAVMERLNDVEISYRQMNVYDLPTANFGQFDIVLFLGVLYHLPDMIRALHLLRQHCRSTLFVETHSENAFCPDIPAARYYPAATLANDHTNFWAPNRLCVLEMLRDTGFNPIRDECWGDRMFVTAEAVTPEGIRREKMELGYGLIGSRWA